MVENRPFLTFMAHAVIILGLLIIVFPIYIAFVASTHATEDLVTTVQPWFGSQMVENYATVLSS